MKLKPVGDIIIAGIQGSGSDGSSPIFSFRWGVESGAAASFSHFFVVESLDQGSPKLFQDTAQGTRLQQVTIELLPDSDGTVVSYVLTDAVVASNAESPSLGAPPLEEVSFDARRIQQTVRTAQGNVVACWDLSSNTVC